MIKIKYFKVLLIFIITIHPALSYGNNYLRIKYSSDNDSFSYKNSYIAYGLQYDFNDKVILNLSFKKLPEETGFYPIGYFDKASWGLYERGSYSVFFKELFGLDIVIFGNFMPHFGQGILLGGGYPLYIYNPYYDLGSFRDDATISKTYSKATVLEGIVAVYSIGRMKVRPFLSYNSYDCSAGESDYYKYNDNDNDGIKNDDDDDDFTGMRDGFLNNYSCKYSLEKAVNDDATYSNNEYRERRNKLTEYIIGYNNSFESDRYICGLTFFYSRFNRMIDPYYDFNPDNGNKSSFYFRGKNYIAGEGYFKIKGNVQFFTDIGGIYYRSLSYYNELSGKRIISIGITSGVRSRIKNASLLLWGAYIPANFVNPHALDYPWGRRNFASIVGSIGVSSDRANFTNWFELSKELFSIDNPGKGEEIDFSYNYDFLYDIFDNVVLEVRQNYRIVDNYYYFPGNKTLKIATKVNLKHKLSKHIKLTGVLESRLGKANEHSTLLGFGTGGRITINKDNKQFKGMLFGYVTGDSILTSLYPYEPSVYRWSFIPSSLNGRGILISTSFTKDIFNSYTAGFKIRYNLNVKDINKSSLKFYINMEWRF